VVVRPAAPVNTDSVAWEAGLKKARELVRRQKGESIEEEKPQTPVMDAGEMSPPLASISPEPDLSNMYKPQSFGDDR